jgi:hypothetical protein
MNREKLISNLETATDKAALIFASQKSISKKSITGSNKIIIEKNSASRYDVVAHGAVIAENISTFDIASAVAHQYNLNQKSIIKKILNLDNTFSKYRMDMMHYLHCMTIAKKRKDIERLSILEDKFQLAEERAKVVRNKLMLFKISK